MAGAVRRLAAYGTLQPGQPNHHQMAGMAGTWRPGSVRGHLHQSGWGAAVGFPGLVADPAGPEVPVSLFKSDDLVDHWPRLDAFEGEGYVRTTIDVATAEGMVQAQIYLLAPQVT
ncbi:gamma-glutamylcyclotransferase family protein [Devosia aurantiaca]|uniref:Gamma-glutamylcyclotransferase n=1 Tax=Devosia aurantiaca TaxID=2714858 RepID=A0A6M1SLI7_9HYPH|nr:gamma-glutamylcyclotransferase family protein [Devosia aurantiaca]NGP17644.1 gamma-glutamylcyclotransferase [Devosia aurantiaca]